MSDLGSSALELAALGYEVFPVIPGSKRPYTRNGFKDATTDPGLIRAYWRQWRRALIGTPSTCVVDIETKPDGPNGWETWRALVAEYGEPVAPTVLTGKYPAGRGAHLHFAYRADVKAGTFADGIELRAAGAYVLLPPSPHASGVRYEGTLPPIGELPPLPEWIAEMRRSRKRQRRQQAARGDSGSIVATGERHEHLREISWAMRRYSGASQGAIEAALLAENELRCKPPKDEDLVKALAEYTFENVAPIWDDDD